MQRNQFIRAQRNMVSLQLELHCLSCLILLEELLLGLVHQFFVHLHDVIRTHVGLLDLSQVYRRLY